MQVNETCILEKRQGHLLKHGCLLGLMWYIDSTGSINCPGRFLNRKGWDRPYGHFFFSVIWVMIQALVVDGIN